jgi:serine/threonine-protein kinase
LEFDAVLDGFEEAWQGGSAPSLRQFLPAGLAATQRREALFELIKIDLDNRWRRSARGRAAPPVPVPPQGSTRPLPERPLVEDYLERFPELGSRDAPPLALVREEYWVRQCWGDRPEHAQYLARFPKQAQEVRAALAQADAELAHEPVRAPDFAQKQSVAPAGGTAQGEAANRGIDTIPRFLDALSDNRILKAGQLKQLHHGDLNGQFADTRALARYLIEVGWLTPYQANQVLTGHAASLVLGSYVLLERAGEGASGKVFKARHQGMNRVVALKVIRPELLANAEAVQRFYQEIQAASRMSYPHVVHAYDAGPVGDTHFLAMEYVEGTNLHRMVAQSGPLPVEHACEYIRQAALGLQHAFFHGLVHRDIKPSNLLVEKLGENSLGRVKILDLGMARWERPVSAERGNGPLTDDGMVMGTPDFMSPEQAKDPRGVDIRSDLYSLGCTFYYLLTGQVPFPRNTFIEKVDAQRFEEPRPIEELRPDIPEWVALSLRRLLAKRPEDRFQTPQELAEMMAAGLGVPNSLGSSSDTIMPDSAVRKALRSTPLAKQPQGPLFSRLGIVIGGVVGLCLLAGLGLALVVSRLNHGPNQNKDAYAGPAAPTTGSKARLVGRKTIRETTLATLKGNNSPTLDAGKWYFIGPFDNKDRKGFGTIYPPESEIDLKKSYPGKGGAMVSWQEYPQFRAGEVLTLQPFKQNNDACIYFYHSFEVREAISLPVSLGSSDALEVWLNGKRTLGRNVGRKVDADQDNIVLDLRAGTNELLVKVCILKPPFGFYIMPHVPKEMLAEAVASKPSVFLSDLIETNPLVGFGRFGKHGNLGYDSGHIVVNGQPSPQGLSLHPPAKGISHVVYRISKYYNVFQTGVALNDTAGQPPEKPITFLVLGDNKVLWKSQPVQKPGEVQDCAVIISGIQTLTLRVHCPGNRDHAHAVWIEPRLVE